MGLVPVTCWLRERSAALSSATLIFLMRVRATSLVSIFLRGMVGVMAV